MIELPDDQFELAMAEGHIYHLKKDLRRQEQDLATAKSNLIDTEAEARHWFRGYNEARTEISDLLREKAVERKLITDAHDVLLDNILGLSVAPPSVKDLIARIQEHRNAPPRVKP